MSFYVYSTNNATGDALLFCFDTPSHFQSQLTELLNTTRSDPPREPLAFLQSTIVGMVVKMYDSSVWRARHHIRKIETVRIFITITATRKDCVLLTDSLAVSRKGLAKMLCWNRTSNSCMKWHAMSFTSVRYLMFRSIRFKNFSMGLER